MGEVKTLLTAEELHRLGSDRRVELVYGEVVEMTPVGMPHGDLVISLGVLLQPFVEQHGLGRVVSEVGFVLSRRPDLVRAPDVAFVAAARLGAGVEGFFEGAPDLAVEVLSPDDRASEIQQKTREYLEAGARLVWIVDPRTRTITTFEPSGAGHVYSGQEAVPGGDVVPGFFLIPARLFRE